MFPLDEFTIKNGYYFCDSNTPNYAVTIIDDSVETPTPETFFSVKMLLFVGVFTFSFLLIEIDLRYYYFVDQMEQTAFSFLYLLKNQIKHEIILKDL